MSLKHKIISYSKMYNKNKQKTTLNLKQLQALCSNSIYIYYQSLNLAMNQI